MAMKRRNRKRRSKTAKTATNPSEMEKAAGPSTLLGKANHQARPGDAVIAPVEVKEPVSDPAAVTREDYVIDLGEELLAAAEEGKLAGDSVAVAEAERDARGNQSTVAVEEEKLEEERAGSPVAVAGADRRIHPRYKFVAVAEVVAAQSGARLETRVRDLSQLGCYVDTSDALSLGTVTDVRIRKGTQLIEAQARVVYSRVGQGMGLMFTAIETQPQLILETWLAESRETSWLAANRRRSQRVLMTVPVRVSGKSGAGSQFEEETQTVAISAHGALILVSTQVYRGQRLTLSNVQTKAAVECVVAHIAKYQGAQPQVGVEFLLPNPIFWHVTFPPKDWTPRHPDAKKAHRRTGESS
jgi:hypothetical protein